MAKEKQNILIIGESSYLASGLLFNPQMYYVEKIKRPFQNDEKQNYKKYNYIINFCIQPEHFTRMLNKSEMIDVQIAKEIVGTDIKQVFLSSRKVYGSSFELKEYIETDELKPYDFYSENKVTIEQTLLKLNPTNTLILRTGNIIGEPTKKKNYRTFIGWIEKELEEKGKVYCTILPNTKKDFITREYFQKVLNVLVQNNISGICNVGAGFAIPIKELMLKFLPKDKVDFSNAFEKSEQFVLKTEKLCKYVTPFSISDIEITTKNVKKYIMENFV